MNAFLQTIEVLGERVPYWICSIDKAEHDTRIRAEKCCADMLSKSVTPPECYAKKQKATKPSTEMNITPYASCKGRRDE